MSGPGATQHDASPTVCPLSVVMPVYNEAPGLPDVVGDIARDILDHVPGSELVVVDDRSTDASGEVLRALAADDHRIRVITNDVNRGHGPTMRAAIDASRGEWLFHLDSDGQVRVDEFAGFWARRADADLVLGVRKVRHDPVHRLVLTRATRLLVSVTAGRRLHDANVPFKLVRRDLYLHLRPFVPADAFAPSVLLAVGAVRAGARVVEVDITHLPRRHGVSTLHLRRLAHAVVVCTRQLVRFRCADLPVYEPRQR